MATQIHALEGLFRALADGTRLRILGLLLSGEVCVCNLHESLGEAQPKISRHLAYLRRAGLVATRREGLWVHYRLAEASDPVRATILLAVTHALGHVDAVRRDTRALRKTTGCAVPPPACQTSFACCVPRTSAGRR
jgi:ArsR family transcriptional regulator, arsenate/arsenite/antimonite-responsive transcriptional repressor